MIAEKQADLRQLTQQDFAALGLADIAYVRPKLVNGATVFAIHTADGNEAAVTPTHETAIATIRQNDLEPVHLQ